MKYNDVVKDIIKYYNKFLTEQELITLKKIEYIIQNKENNDVSDEIVFFLNRILDRIWNNTLTDIKNFKNGENFCFLIKEEDLSIVPQDYENLTYEKPPRVLSTCSYNDILYNYVDLNNDEFQLITEEDIINMDINNTGLIISINYKNNIRTVPLLPIYFKKKLKVDLNYDVNGYYAVDTKLEEIDSVFLSTKEDSINNGLPLIMLDKTLYRKNNNNELISNDDLKEIVMIFVLDYFNYYDEEKLMTNPNKIRDIMLKNDKNNIKREIIKYYNNNITIENLSDYIYELIDFYVIDLTSKRKK